jgi:hypothetical protein
MMSKLQTGVCLRWRQRGAALIIVLALLVLLTALMAIFLSRALIERKVSASSASGNSASILARSAVDMITGDLRQEIVSGSTATVVGPTTNKTTLYFPISVTNMVPQRAGNATNSLGDQAPNLIRRSYRFDTNSLFVPSRASAVNSYSDVSYNGRSIALSRWNSHYLIPRASAGNSTIDSTPVSAFVAPDWVMVTTNGPTVMATPSPTAIGRYAYAIYDEGGLLDANVAGCPSGMTNYLPSQLAGKGSLALADLTAIGFTASQVDNLVGWRNYATVQPSSGSFGSYNFSSDANASTNFYSYVSSNTNGYLVVNPQQYNNRTDQAFSSRQALLKYQRSAGFSQDALQYLGTSSRDLEQPLFYPDPNRPKNTTCPLTGSSSPDGGNDTYDATGATQNSINPSLLTVRDAIGNPVMKRRFPLSRLALFTAAKQMLLAHGTLTTTQVQNMYQYFGLTWDSTNCRWVYSHLDAAASYGGTPPVVPASQILRLSNIAALNVPTREPDFFETLKAVIVCDSLGKQNGGTDGNYSMHRFTGGLAYGYDGITNYQLIKIGANLLDQYGSDSYPTDIGFDGLDFYGIKNLPYFAGWSSTWYRMRQLTSANILGAYQPPAPAAGKNGFPYETATLLQPILWNPHVPNVQTSTYVPTSFKIFPRSYSTTVAVSMYPEVCSTDTLTYASTNNANGAWYPTFNNEGNSTTTPPAFPLVNGAATTPSPYSMAVVSTNNYITYNTAATGAAAFQEPYRLHAPSDPAGSNVTSDEILTTSDAGVDPGYSQALGFYTGMCWTGPSNSVGPSFFNEGSMSQTLRMDMQYANPYAAIPAFLTYDIIDYAYLDGLLSTGSANNGIADSDDTVDIGRGERMGLRFDPRTECWGVPTINAAPTWDSRITMPTGVTLNTVTPFTSATGMHIWPFPQGATIAPTNTAGNPASYFRKFTGDNSGGLPKSAGWHSSGSSLGTQLSSDVMANLLTVPGQTYTASGTTLLPGGKMFYADPDGVLRRATGAYYTTTSPDGLPLQTANYNSRPVILNRPFQSIAEMGYAFRATPWKNLDFYTPESGDSALLDAFCLNELPNKTVSGTTDVIVAGKVNLNTRQPKVLQALIQGASKAEGGIVSATEAGNAAQALVNWTTNTVANDGGTTPVLEQGPLRNRSELVGKWVSSNNAILTTANGFNYTWGPTYINGSVAYSGYSSMLASPAVFTNSSSAAIIRQRECVMRALADSGNTRTWNLLIDVIAQTGHYAPTATAASALPQFIVTGESRYWVHVAIDRYTGTIISESFEPVED